MQLAGTALLANAADLADALRDPQVARAVVLISVSVALLLPSRRLHSPGSVFVGGALALQIGRPTLLLAVALASVAAFTVVKVVEAGRWSSLRWSGAAAAFIASAVVVGVCHAVGVGPAGQGRWMLSAMGIMAPAFLALDAVRVGAAASLRALVVTTAVPVGFVFAVVHLLPTLLPTVWPLVVHPALAAPVQLALSSGVEPLAVIVSVAAAVGLRANLGLRSGGLPTAALLASLANRPLAAFMVLAVAAFTRTLIARLGSGRLLLVGGSVLGIHAVVGGLTMWLVTAALVRLGGPFATTGALLDSLPVLGAVAAGILASDMNRGSAAASLVGLGLNLCFVLAVGQLTMAIAARTWSIDALPRVIIAFATALTIFSPQSLRIGRLLGRLLWMLEPDPAATLLANQPKPVYEATAQVRCSAREAQAFLAGEASLFSRPIH